MDCLRHKSCDCHRRRFWPGSCSLRGTERAGGYIFRNCSPESLTHYKAGRIKIIQKLAKIGDFYDDLMYDPSIWEYYDQSDFHNFGYWDKNTRGQKEACADLMDRLIALIPEKRGTVLDVACGKGATTQYLLRRFWPSNVVGINISEKQLRTATVNSPDCAYFVMDAVHLAFGDESSQITSAFRRAGFQDMRIVDATKECWRGFRRLTSKKGWLYLTVVIDHLLGR
jgi:SAM-dependent methyltransferase